MNLRTIIHQTLTACPRVTDIIGVGDVARHYFGKIQNSPARSYVISSLVASTALETHGTETDAEDTADETRMQFSCYADSMTEATALYLAVRRALINKDEVASQQVLLENDVSVSDPDSREQDESDTDLYCVQLDVTFFHNPNS